MWEHCSVPVPVSFAVDKFMLCSGDSNPTGLPLGFILYRLVLLALEPLGKEFFIRNNLFHKCLDNLSLSVVSHIDYPVIATPRDRFGD